MEFLDFKQKYNNFSENYINNALIPLQNWRILFKQIISLIVKPTSKTKNSTPKYLFYLPKSIIVLKLC